MLDRNRWTPFVLLAGGTVLGAAAAFSAVPAMSKLSAEWIGFYGSIAGGLVGGLLGIAAGWLALTGVRDQIRETQKQRKEGSIASARIAYEHIGELAEFSNSIADATSKWLKYNPPRQDAEDDLVRTIQLYKDIPPNIFTTADMDTALRYLPISTVREVRKCMALSNALQNDFDQWPYDPIGIIRHSTRQATYELNHKSRLLKIHTMPALHNIDASIKALVND